MHELNLPTTPDLSKIRAAFVVLARPGSGLRGFLEGGKEKLVRCVGSHICWTFDDSRYRLRFV